MRGRRKSRERRKKMKEKEKWKAINRLIRGEERRPKETRSITLSMANNTTRAALSCYVMLDITNSLHLRNAIKHMFCEAEKIWTMEIEEEQKANRRTSKADGEKAQQSMAFAWASTSHSTHQPLNIYTGHRAHVGCTRNICRTHVLHVDNRQHYNNYTTF